MEKLKLTRRDALKLGTLGLISSLAACSPFDLSTELEPTPMPQLEQKKSLSLKEADMEELERFYEISKGLEEIYGSKIFDLTFANCVRDMHLACKDALENGIYSETFKSSYWGVERQNRDNFIQDHFENVSLKNIFIPPADPFNHPDYVPPSASNVEIGLRNFASVFPLLTIPVDKYSVLPSQFRTSYLGRYYVEEKKVETANPDEDPELFFHVTFHENTHAAEINYMALRPYMSLAEYTRIPTELIKQTAKIANDYLNLSGEDQSFYDYGLHLSFDDINNPNLREVFDRAVLALNFSFPDEMTVKNGDDDNTVRNKENMQFNYILYTVGNSKLKKDGIYSGDSADELMSVFFSQITHYLTGPYTENGAFPDEYISKPVNGIGLHHLAMHITRMEVFANPVIYDKPVEIRKALGLPATNDVFMKYGAQLLEENPVFNGIDYLYLLPSTDTQEHFLIKNNDDFYHNSLISVPLGSGLDPKYIMGLDINDPLKRRHIRTVYSVQQYTADTIIGNSNTKQSANNFGVTHSDKIIVNGSPANILWQKHHFDGSFLRLFQTDEFIIPNRLLSLDTRTVSGPSFQEGFIITESFGRFSPLKALTPDLLHENVRMGIIDMRNYPLIVIEDDSYGKFELKVAPEIYDYVYKCATANPNTRISLQFSTLDLGNGFLKLKIGMKVYPDEFYSVEGAPEFEAEGINIIPKENMAAADGKVISAITVPPESIFNPRISSILPIDL